MLVAISIIMILAAIIYPTLDRLVSSARQAKCVSNLMQIGTAIQLYVNDHDMQLPGPLYANQSAWYSDHNPGMLSVFIAPYLDQPDPDDKVRWLDVFFCPSWKAAVSNPTDLNQRAYHVPQNGALPSKKIGTPFGYPGSSANGEPMKVTAINYAPIGTLPALTDKNLDTGLPAHKTFRNTLYFDWHVETISSTDLRFSAEY